MEINLKSAFFGTQLAAKQMIAQGGGGRIINISSVHEDWPMPGNAPYCLSKGGMRMLTRQAGQELGPHNIQVVGVGPGAVATPINTSTMADPEKMKTLDTAIPLGRMADPAEIGSVVAFLAGDGASYINGTTIFADGGPDAFQPGPVGGKRPGRIDKGDPHARPYDVIIIGTGAGGGTLAHTLAAGRKADPAARAGGLPAPRDGELGPERGVHRREVHLGGDLVRRGRPPFQPQVHYFVGGATKL